MFRGLNVIGRNKHEVLSATSDACGALGRDKNSFGGPRRKSRGIAGWGCPRQWASGCGFYDRLRLGSEQRAPRSIVLVVIAITNTVLSPSPHSPGFGNGRRCTKPRAYSTLPPATVPALQQPPQRPARCRREYRFGSPSSAIRMSGERFVTRLVRALPVGDAR
jgi:hypothetical protein